MCRVTRIARSGYYAWRRCPVSARASDDERLLGLIEVSWQESGRVYGSPRIHRDLEESGERVGRKRVERIMKKNKIHAIRGYRKPRSVAGGRPSGVVSNLLDRRFTVPSSDEAWVTDFSYIRTWEGWVYLAVVVDLYSRMVVGWSMKNSPTRELVLAALLAAVMRRQPGNRVLVHSDQGSQYDSDDWSRFCKANNLEPSMSRRGNCWDNAVAESFFSSLKKERIRKHVYRTRELARAEHPGFSGLFNVTGKKAMNSP